MVTPPPCEAAARPVVPAAESGVTRFTTTPPPSSLLRETLCRGNVVVLGAWLGKGFVTVALPPFWSNRGLLFTEGSSLLTTYIDSAGMLVRGSRFSGTAGWEVEVLCEGRGCGVAEEVDG